MAPLALFFYGESGTLPRLKVYHALRLLIGLHVEGCLPLPLVDDRQIMHGVGVVRIDLDGALIGVLRPAEVASIDVEVSQAIVDHLPVDAVPERLNKDIDPLLVGFLLAQCLGTLERLLHSDLLLLRRLHFLDAH